jgi:iron complex outermembrane receptor protein
MHSLFPIRRAVALALFACLPAVNQAADTVLDASLQLGEVSVTAQRTGSLPATAILSSVDILGNERLRDADVTDAWQLFAKVPGTMLTQFNQGNTSGKFSFRGFNGEGEINAIKLLIDGVPSNSNDGNMPYIDMVLTQELDSIEVVRGTNDPRYGLHNIAGNANLRTVTGGDYLRSRASYGSFGTLDLQAAAGVEQDSLAQNYAAGYTSSDGYRDHSVSSRSSLSGKWNWTAPEGGSHYGAALRFAELRAQESGYLTDAQSRSNPRQSPVHNASDGDIRQLGQASFQGENTIGDLSWSNLAYLNDLKDRRFVRFSVGTAQQERDTDERQLGLQSTLTWRAGRTALGDLTLEGGLSGEWQDNISERYTTLLRARQAQTRNQHFRFDIVGAYVEAVLQPTERLKLIPALRVDDVQGSYLNLRNGVRYPINDYGIVSQPKFSAVYALSDTTSLYGNWGRSFQVGIGTASYAVNQTAPLSPSMNEGWELGAKFRPARWLEGRATLWEQLASNEARRKLNDPANDSENIGRTRRRGLDLQVNAPVAEHSALWMSWSYQQSKILKAESSLPASQGKEIDHVPQQLYALGIDQQFTAHFALGASLNGQSSYYLERTNTTGHFGSSLLVDAAAKWTASAGTQVQLQVKNLFDRYAEYVWWDGAQSLHSPVNGRAAYLSVTVSR